MISWLRNKQVLRNKEKKGDKMNIILNIPEETQEFYFEIAKERNITKEELMEVKGITEKIVEQIKK